MRSIANYSKGILTRLKRTLVSLLFDRLKDYKVPIKSSRILIVRLDAIGDYVLFRNFIGVLSRHPKWGDFKITLLGSRTFQGLAESFDSNSIHEFVWVDPDIVHDTYRRNYLALKLKLKAFDILISPVHSRTASLDTMVSSFGAKYLIGSDGDDIFFKDESEKLSMDKLYDQLLPSLTFESFEFFRNHQFFNALVGTDIKVKLSLPWRQSSLAKQGYCNILIFPGAGRPYRQWSTNNFAKVIRSLNDTIKTPLHFYILGGKTDSSLADTIITECGLENITDLTGKTSLKEVVDLIGSSNVVISNESSAVHIAAATMTPAVCVSNGNHYGRFNPYPPEISNNVSTIYPSPDFYTSDDKERKMIARRHRYKSDLNINVIQPSVVYDAALELINTSEIRRSAVSG